MVKATAYGYYVGADKAIEQEHDPECFDDSKVTHRSNINIYPRAFCGALMHPDVEEQRKAYRECNAPRCVACETHPKALR